MLQIDSHSHNIKKYSDVNSSIQVIFYDKSTFRFSTLDNKIEVLTKKVFVSETCVWRTSRDVRWNVLHTHHAGGNDTSRIHALPVLLKVHAQEFTDHLNRIDKLTTEGEVITHTSRDEE